MNELFLESEDTLFHKIYANEIFSMDAVINKKFTFLSYISVYDEQIFFSVDFSYIIFKIGCINSISIDTIKNLLKTKKNEIIDLLKELFYEKKESFQKFLSDDDAISALLLYNNRDLVQQYSLMITKFIENSKSFSIESLFDCGVYVYSSIDDPKSYCELINILENLYCGVKERVKDNLYSKLSDRINDNNEIIVYRGSKEDNINGFSYTLSYEKASFFAKRWNTEGGIISKYKIKIDDILAYSDIRNEKEIISKNATLIDTVVLD